MADETLWDKLRDNIERLGMARQRDPAAVSERLATRARLLRGRATGEAAPSQLLLAFNKGRQRFAVPLENVLEVQALEHVSPAPRTPPFVVGVIHWRGAVLALLDIGRLFGAADSGLADMHVCIIVEAASRRLALAALEVEDLVAVAAGTSSDMPELPAGVPAEWTLGVREDSRIILNIDAIVRDPKITIAP